MAVERVIGERGGGVEVIALADGRVDVRTRRVHRGDHSARLTEREVEVLGYLAARPDQPVPRAELLTEVWGYHADARTRTVDVTIKRMRGKIEANPAAPVHLLAVRGVGYRFRPARRAPAPGLFGRADALDALLRAWDGGAALITLVGPGGVGKTALARAFLAARPGRFVDLSAARDAAGIAQAIADALTAPLAAWSEAAMIDQLGRLLASQGGPVVLDNVEQVAPSMRALVARWPGARLVLTSREALDGPTEVRIPVTPLAIAPATALFIARAANVGAPAVVERLVARLDGLPLAIELAAARTAVLSPAEILARIDARFALLRGRVGPARQASLRATLAWSWDHLEPRERAALAAASIFRGGFDFDAAEAVLGDAALDGLQGLMRKSLLVRRDDCFELLESVRAFAAEQLGEAAKGAHARLARWCVARGEGLPEGAARQGWVRRERENLRVARRHAPDPALATRAGLLLLPVLHQWGPLPLYRAVAEAAVESAGLTGDPRLMGRALLHRAAVRRGVGALDPALADAEAAEAHARAAADAVLCAEALARQGNIARARRDPAAGHRLFAEALAALGDRDAPRVRAAALRGWANVLHEEGRFDEAETRNAAALQLLRAAGADAEQGVLEGNLAMVALDAGRLAQARAGFRRARRLHAQVADRRFLGVLVSNQALLEHLEGHLSAARDAAQEALRLHRAVGNRRFEGFTRYVLAAVDHEAGDLDAALDGLIAALGLWRAVGERRYPAFAACRLALIEAERGMPHAVEAALADAGQHADAMRALIDAAPVAPTGSDTFAGINHRLRVAMSVRNVL